MTSDSVRSQQVPSYFLQEASELLQQMDGELQTLSQDFGVQKVYALMRIAHTLKGAAASVGLDHIKTTTHSLENVFRALCSPNASLTPAIESLIFEGYGCLQLLLSAQIAEAQIDEPSILERMADVVSKLEKHLGSRFGQDGYLPTSSELGVDITQSVFEKGITKRLQQLEVALETPDPENLKALLRSQADVFSGLAESFNLPGFGAIVQTTLKALECRPDLAVQIAQIALDDYRAGQRLVLDGDRNRGGEPSLVLKKLATPPKSAKNNWLGQVWNALNQPIPGTTAKHQTATKSQSPPTADPSHPPNSPPPIPEPGAANRGAFADLLTTSESVAIAEKDELFTPHQGGAGLDTRGSRTEGPRLSDLPVPKSASKTSSIPTLNAPNLKISVDHLDKINHAIGDLLTQQNRQALHNQQLATASKALLKRLEQQQQQLTKLLSQASHSALAHTPSRSTEYQFDTLEFDNYSELQLQVQASLDTLVQQIENAEAIELFVRQNTQAVEKQQRLIKTLRETVVEARMQPIDNVFQRFHQVLGRLVAQQGKPVELLIEGGHVLVDKMIADKLYEPLLHLIRNAFDHGVEKASERKQQGKIADAKITLSAKQEGHHLSITVRDNGRGLNLDNIREKAIYQQLITADEAQQLTSDQISELIFEPGFSTSAQVNDISGRGFGLDAVRAQIYPLHGRVTVTHKPDQETCFTLELPTNLTIARLLLCQTGETLYTFMTDAIEQILVPKPEQLSTRNERKMLSWELEGKEYLVPVISLADALNYNAKLPHSHWRRPDQTADISSPILIMRHQDKILGLECDHLLGEQELVIRSLGDMAFTPEYFYGCSILPNGRLSLVIDGSLLTVNVLQQSSQTLTVSSPPPGSQAKPSTPGKQSILIVDDSITVRNTLALGLQKAGYLVIQAKEGSEALQKLEHTPVTVILCDLEMPGMNGFDFLRARQRIPTVASVPTIMLTSRTGDKHRHLAQSLGADNYLTKPYLMPQLIETINNVLTPDA
ncbi:chemotaxis protein histidine kinase-like protein [Leptolyngbya sp. PCC 7375]|nr:chemotaxis protein histidine kinase-like protein [Leptolyngbya sp. PCC 7375]